MLGVETGVRKRTVVQPAPLFGRHSGLLAASLKRIVKFEEQSSSLKHKRQLTCNPNTTVMQKEPV